MPVYKDPIKKTYNISYYVNGKRKFKRTNIKNEQEALKFEKELKGQELNLKFNELYERFINYYKNIYSENTIAKYEYIYKNQLTNLYSYRIKDISSVILLKLQNDLTKKYSNIRVNETFYCIKSIMDFGIKFYNLEYNPVSKIDFLKVDDTSDISNNYLTYEEYLKFIKCVDDKKYKIIFNILFFYGIRISELTALKVDDFFDHKMRIDESRLAKVPKRLKGNKKLKSTKNNKIEYLHLSNWIWEMVISYIKDLKLKSNDYVFGFNGKALSESTFRRNYDSYFNKSGVRRITVHGFRHSCASYYISKGISIAYVSKLLRHSSINITMKYYFHFYKKEMEKITDIVESAKFEIGII